MRRLGMHIIAHDLGTGGDKATIYDVDGTCLASLFVSYETFYPAAGWHEQHPADWWDAVAGGTRRLLADTGVEGREVACLALSGQSLGVVPLDEAGQLLRSSVPIWSDTRAAVQTEAFFRDVDEEAWYLRTGNGFPASCYPVFKLMWYREHEPVMYGRIHTVLGSKDYVNFRLTGRSATDHSYASGSGVYDLQAADYAPELLASSGLPLSMFPEILPSTGVLGGLTEESAAALGLPRSVQVICGGVDNSCMATGARGIADGRVYTSLAPLPGSRSHLTCRSLTSAAGLSCSPT